MSRLVSEVYQSDWLNAADLRGQSVTVVVERATVEKLRQVDGSRVDKVVLGFVGKQKRWALNATQARALAGMLGDEIDVWPGAQVRIGVGVAPNGRGTIVVEGAR